MKRFGRHIDFSIKYSLYKLDDLVSSMEYEGNGRGWLLSACHGGS